MDDEIQDVGDDAEHQADREALLPIHGALPEDATITWLCGYWRDGIQVTTDVFDQYVDFYYTTEQMDETGMGVRFDFATLAADRNLRNKVFDAVDTHGDWLRLQTSIYEITKRINAQLTAP